jgi:uncharacterized damage-inducible protein DinB
MIDELTTRIDEITDRFKTSFIGLDHEKLNQRPHPQSWSIAENMEHLIQVNETYYTALASLKAGTYTVPFTGRIGFLVNMFGKMILNSVKPETKRKTKTFAVWQPLQSKASHDILSRFEKHQEELKKQIATSGSLVEKKAVISSPANRNIVYTLGTAFEIIVAHEERHLKQAREALEQIGRTGA